MMSPSRASEPSRTRPGARAREQLIEAAGEEFADKGLLGATSREICLRAGVSTAAVNYHFGGFDALYVATIAEAHRRVAGSELPDFEDGEGKPPKEKLIALLRPMIERMIKPSPGSWEMRLVARELISPTPLHAAFFETAIQPRLNRFKTVIGEIIGLPADDPVVGRAMLTVIAPCILLAIADRSTMQRILPGMSDPKAESEALVSHIELFAIAGLEATTVNGKQKRG